MSDAVLLALISSIAPTLAAFAALVVSLRNGRKIDEVKDGMQSKMMAAENAKGVADGKAEGIESERQRQPAVSPPLGAAVPTGTPEDPVAVVQVKKP